jgi:hypothetical protein
MTAYDHYIGWFACSYAHVNGAFAIQFQSHVVTCHKGAAFKVLEQILCTQTRQGMKRL